MPGRSTTSQDISSTHHKLLSLALHYLPFASRFPLPHFTLAVLFALSFPSPLFHLLSLPSWLVLYLLRCLPKMKFSILNEGREKNLKYDWYRICNAQNRSTKKQSTFFLLRNFYIGATTWYRYILDTITGGISWVAILLTLIMLR